MNKRSLTYSGLILIFAVVLGFLTLPGEIQKKIVPFIPEFISSQKINLGLDLQGGSQLDYKIDLRKVAENDRKSIIEGVRSVIEKRVNNLGVSEPNIYTSTIGDETHIIVELAGIKDLDEAKKIVGKTIQLEFKERKEEIDPEYKEKIKKEAEEGLKKAKEIGFESFGEMESKANPNRIFYYENEEFVFEDNLSASYESAIKTLEKGQIAEQIFASSGEYTIDPLTGGIVQASGYYLVKLIDKEIGEKEIKEPKKIKIAQILVAHKDSSLKQTETERSEEEAKARINEALNKINELENETSEETSKGDIFGTVAKEFSDDLSTKEQGGIIEDYVTEKSANFLPEISAFALKAEKAGEISDIIETPFGFHIIKVLEIQEEIDTKEQAFKYKVATIFYDSTDDQWNNTGLDGRFFQRADVIFDDMYNTQVSISFTPEGASLFEELTGKNLNKPIAIFVGGELISAPNVNEKISGGNAVISGNFTIKEAQQLARDLNTGAIPAPIILSGQHTIGASLGQEALNKSLNAALIGFALIAIFLIIYYRFAGIVATVALGIYSTILLFLIKTSLPLWLAMLISLMIFIALVIKIINGKDPGSEKLVSLILSCFVLFFLSFLLSSQVVLTLAGVAGVILSIGMAVDANILIFERIKEELRNGRKLDSAIQTGFDRAWSSIKDSNFSSLITCAILFYFGSSIIQGFAFNLAAGILISMFTAISITKVFLKSMIGGKLSEYKGLFGFPKKQNTKPLPIIEKRNFFYGISIITVILVLISIGSYGFKLGMDFTGGALLEIKLEKETGTNELKDALIDIQQKINEEKTNTITDNNGQNETAPKEIFESATFLSAHEEEKLDLNNAIVISGNDSIIIKTKSISNIQHERIIQELKNKFGELEELRFQSIGPTVGESMTYKALFAVLIAIIAIVIYVAFAFRKVPNTIGKWKFGTVSIIALIHDVIIMLGMFVIFGQLYNVEIDALFITAVLTALGFSVHDTIVVLDRLREKLKNPEKNITFAGLVNIAVNETLPRSINTSLTTALALITLAFLGAENIKFFNIALLIGIVVGTYSSVFIASALLVDWASLTSRKKHKKLNE